MKARGSLVFLACATAALLALPAAAGASQALTLKNKGLHLQVFLPASHGYTAILRTSGHHQVTLTLAKGDVVASYRTLGTVSRKGIKADFGRFGQMNLHFRGKSGPRPANLVPSYLPFLDDKCKGRRPVREAGLFRGNIRFAGENGYSRVVAHRLRGSVSRTSTVDCRLGSGRAGASSAEDRPEIVFFSAIAKGGGVTRVLLTLDIGFAGKGGKVEGLSLDIGGRMEKVGRTMITKFGLIFGDPAFVALSPKKARPVTAKMRLPAPFSGTGLYEDDGRQPPSWTGSLGIRLPGVGLVPLTGPEFDAFLCRATTGREADRCEEQLGEVEPLLYGSGSHSQPLALARLSSLRYRWNLSSSLGSIP